MRVCLFILINITFKNFFLGSMLTFDGTLRI
jgi:hypothetical protein